MVGLTLTIVAPIISLSSDTTNYKDIESSDILIINMCITCTISKECQLFIVDGGVVKRSRLLVSTLVKALFYLLEQDCTESEHIYHRGRDGLLMKP